jgi:hypothetical protein
LKFRHEVCKIWFSFEVIISRTKEIDGEIIAGKNDQA